MAVENPSGIVPFAYALLLALRGRGFASVNAYGWNEWHAVVDTKPAGGRHKRVWLALSL